MAHRVIWYQSEDEDVPRVRHKGVPVRTVEIVALWAVITLVMWKGCF
jgi:hypothetical protein